MFHQGYQEKLGKENMTRLIVHLLTHRSSKDTMPFIFVQILVEEHISLLKGKQRQLIWKPGEQQ